MGEMTIAQIFFWQIPASEVSGEGGSGHGKRKEKVPNQHYTQAWAGTLQSFNSKSATQ